MFRIFQHECANSGDIAAMLKQGLDRALSGFDRGHECCKKSACRENSVKQNLSIFDDD